MRTYENITKIIDLHENYDFSYVFIGFHRSWDLALKEALSKTTTFAKSLDLLFFFLLRSCFNPVPALNSPPGGPSGKMWGVLRQPGRLGKLWKASKRVHGVLNTPMLTYRLHYRCPMQFSSKSAYFAYFSGSNDYWQFVTKYCYRSSFNKIPVICGRCINLIL